MFGFNFTESQKGYLALFIGVILLFNSLGLFTSLFRGIVLIFALFLIAYGLMSTHVAQVAWKKINNLRK